MTEETRQTFIDILCDIPGLGSVWVLQATIESTWLGDGTQKTVVKGQADIGPSDECMGTRLYPGCQLVEFDVFSIRQIRIVQNKKKVKVINR